MGWYAIILLGLLTTEPADEERRVLEARRSIRSGEFELVVEKCGGQNPASRKRVLITFDGANRRTEYPANRDLVRETAILPSDRIPAHLYTRKYVMSDVGVISYADDGTVATILSAEAEHPPLSFFEIRALGLVAGGLSTISHVTLDTAFQLDQRISSTWSDLHADDGKPLRQLNYERSANRSGTMCFSPSEGGEIRSIVLNSLYNGRQLRTEIENEVTRWDGGVWFPKRVTRRTFLDGKETDCETTEVVKARFNVAIPPATFKVEGMGIKPGTQIIDMRPNAEHAKVWDGKKAIVLRTDMTTSSTDRKPTIGRGGILTTSFVLAGISAVALYLWLRSRRAA